MTSYNLGNIRTLLLQGFTDAELRRLCFDVPGFRPVYDSLSSGSGKAEIVDRLLEYAERQVQMEALLELARQGNPRRYELHGPYTGAAGPGQPGSTSGGAAPAATAGPGQAGGAFTLSGNFQGAIINIGSSLTQVTQTIGQAPGVDPVVKEELQRLVGQLQAALQQAPLSRAEEAQAVADLAETLFNQAIKDKPNKSLVQITGEGLKQAAQNLAGAAPAVLDIAIQIVGTVGKCIR